MIEKLCNKCKQAFPLSQFHNNKASKDGKTARCKTCFIDINKTAYNSEYQATYRKNNPERIAKLKKNAYRKAQLKRWQDKGYELRNGFPILAYDKIWELFLENGCMDCDEKNPMVLEFDHLRDKTNNIATITNRYSYWNSKLAAEIAKCDIVCRNCHVVRTYTRTKSWRYMKAVSQGLIT